MTALVQPMRVGVWPRIGTWCLIGAWCHRRWKEGGLRQPLVFLGLASVLDEWTLLGVSLLVLIVSAEWKVGAFLRDKLRRLENYLLAVARVETFAPFKRLRRTWPGPSQPALHPARGGQQRRKVMVWLEICAP